ncbi:ChaB family protein [Roseiarcaceae bacterium H3SJ34-1]|uniref:ChaB family protein n=1 Tax=Terripilifer ovatus TaxID=3032367 RepID=UPI003AB947D8|nr:ChaB family protein [Roseiarcaceae bacterium H3SJ34-1]
MPYVSVEDLPAPARAQLPEHAQEIYRNAFNRAWLEYADRDAGAHEAMAHRIAWAAVKYMYRKDGRQWVEQYPPELRL